jgi:hypothetical protein
MRRVSASAALAATVVLAGCSSTTNCSGSVAGGAGPATSTPASPVAPSPSDSGAVASRLQALVLQRSDVPSDWTAGPHTESPTGNADEQRILSCIGTGVNPEAGQVAHADSDDYNQGDSQITSSATLWQSKAAVDQQIALLLNPRTQTCFAAGFRRLLTSSAPSGATVADFHLTLEPGHGALPADVIARMHVSAVLTVAGQSLGIFADVAFIAHGRLTAEVDFFGAGGQIAPALSARLAATVAHRVAHD